MKFGLFHQLPCTAGPSVVGRCREAIASIQPGFPDFQIQEEL